MTINEYIGDLVVEADSIYSDLACESIMYNFYAETEEDETPAVEDTVDSLSLTFDDMEEESVDTPAFEAAKVGFFDKLRNAAKSVAHIFKGIALSFKKFLDNIKMVDLDIRSDAVSEVNHKMDIDERAKFDKKHINKKPTQEEVDEFNKGVDERNKRMFAAFAKSVIGKVNFCFTSLRAHFNDLAICEDKMLEVFRRCVDSKEFRTMEANMTDDSKDNAAKKASLSKYVLAADKLEARVKTVVEAAGKEVDECEEAFNSHVDAINILKTKSNGKFKQYATDIVKKVSKVKIGDLKKAAEEMQNRCNKFADETESMSNTFNTSEKGASNNNFSVLGNIFSKYTSIARSIADVSGKFIKVCGHNLWTFAA